MDTSSERTPIALFVALTRTVREAPVQECARERAYNIIDRMACAASVRSFEVELEALVACATDEKRFYAALQPFWKELRALSASSFLRVDRGPKDR